MTLVFFPYVLLYRICYIKYILIWLLLQWQIGKLYRTINKSAVERTKKLHENIEKYVEYSEALCYTFVKLVYIFNVLRLYEKKDAG